MLKKLAALTMVLSFTLLSSSCASARKREYRRSIYGWEYVRIERRVPDKSCVYKVQEVCGEKSIPACLNWYKQRAKRFGANTVVLIEDERDRALIAGSPNPIAPVVKSSVTATVLLADYYNCPKCEPSEQK